MVCPVSFISLQMYEWMTLFNSFRKACQWPADSVSFTYPYGNNKL